MTDETKTTTRCRRRHLPPGSWVNMRVNTMTPAEFVEAVGKYLPVGDHVKIVELTSDGEVVVQTACGQDIVCFPVDAERLLIGAVVGEWPHVRIAERGGTCGCQILDEDLRHLGGGSGPTKCLAALSAHAAAWEATK